MKSISLNLIDKFKENLFSLFVVSMAFFAPLIPLMILIGLSIFLDTFTGIWKSKKAGVPITSRRLSSVISKMLVYQMVAISIYFLDVNLISQFTRLFIDMDFFLTKVICLVMISIEIFSIDENIKGITGKSIIEMLKKLLKSFKTFKQDFL
jgi:hypothetical protein